MAKYIQINNFNYINVQMLNLQSFLTANQSSARETPSFQSKEFFKENKGNQHIKTVDSKGVFEEKDSSIISITQQELQSRKIVRELMQKSKQKCIKTEYSQISPHTRLYRTVYTEHSPRYSLDNQLKASERAKPIYNKLNDQTSAYKRIQLSFKSKQKKRILSDSEGNNKAIYRAKSVSIAGLTTYNFQSVKARTRIAYDPQGTQDEVQQQNNLTKIRTRCSLARSQKIHIRTCPTEANQNISLNEVISYNYEGVSTEDYLRAIQKEKEYSKDIYGQKSKYIQNIPKIMKLDGINHQTAEFTVEKIKMTRPSQKLYLRKKDNRQKINQDLMFEKRKIPVNHKKVFVSVIQLQ